MPLWIGAATAFVLLLFAQGTITGIDGDSQFATAKAIVDRHALAIGPNLQSTQGLHGRWYSWYGIGFGVITAVPYALGKLAATVIGHANEVELFATSSLIPILCGLIVIAMIRLARTLGASLRSSVIVALAVMFGTFFMPYSKEYLTEPAVILSLLVCYDEALHDRQVTSGTALAVACLIRQQTFVMLPVLAFIWWRRGGIAAVIRGAVPVAVAGAVTAWVNQARFGSVTNFGYAGQTFRGNVASNSWRLLVSPYKGVVIFAPIIVLVPFATAALWRARPDGVILLAAGFAITFALDAAWWDWKGGWCWGPRLLLPGLVPLFAVLGPWIDRSARRLRLLGALALAGFVISGPVMVTPMEAQLQYAHPSGPQIVRQFRLVPTIARYTLHHAKKEQTHILGVSQRFIDVWQVGLIRSLGKAGGAVALAGTVVFLVALALALRRAATLWPASAGAAGRGRRAG
ncbi:MAG: hypothetical protein ACHQNA_00590 [Acidimicrobiales bacterium]